MNRHTAVESERCLEASQVAYYFLQKEPLDHLTLQKLVYLAHGWTLALLDEPLILEKIQAWRWGPVVPEMMWWT